MREVVAAAGRGEERAALALDVYVHRLGAAIAAMAAAMGGLDALVFTGGVGENSAAVRARACAAAAFLGVELDPERNERCVPTRSSRRPAPRPPSSSSPPARTSRWRARPAPSSRPEPGDPRASSPTG